MTVTSLLDGRAVAPSGVAFRATHAASGAPLDPEVYPAAPADVERAVRLAQAAAPVLAAASGDTLGALLDRIADEIDADADAIVARAHAETGLPEGRLRGETGRTTGQLRLFAHEARRGTWRDVRIDRADPDRTPAPRPDLRSMRVPRGPVAVFGASNFPLAFSVAGGDTASALAVGCPVVVKSHPAHPGTSILVGEAVARAVAAVGLPAGTFGLLLDGGHDVGVALVRQPGVAAVGFTGSRRAGLALAAVAAARDVPIPVFAEMGSVNPVVVLGSALADGGGTDLAQALAASVTLGAGQFCTCPGLVFVPEGTAGDAFVAALAESLAATPPAPMLTPAHADAYRNGVNHLGVEADLRVRVDAAGTSAGAALAEVRGATFAATPSLAEETFGPATLAVRTATHAELMALLEGLEGQLTATLHTAPEDPEAAAVLAALAARAGRVLVGGVPTGVEVNQAIVHGGPFPATSDGGSTSVGARAAERWTRLVAYQDAPDALLPPPLRDANPWGVPRLVDGAPESDGAA